MPGLIVEGLRFLNFILNSQAESSNVLGTEYLPMPWCHDLLRSNYYPVPGNYPVLP